MPFNGSGVFQRVRNWVADATAGIKIRADYHDTEDDGFATGLTNCITKDGQTIVTQNIPMNAKRITGLADPVNPQDAATKASADAAGALKVSKTGDNMTGALTTTGSIHVGYGVTSGSIAFINGSRYLNFDSVTGNFTLVGGPLTVSSTITAGNNVISYITGLTGTFQFGNGTYYLHCNGTRYTLPTLPVHIGFPLAATDAARVDWATASLVNNGSVNLLHLAWNNTSFKLGLSVDNIFQGYVVISPTAALTMESLLARIEALESKGT